MSLVHRVSLIAALLGVTGGSALAHPNAGELEVGLFGGWHVFDSSQLLGSEDGEKSGVIADGPVFGLRGSYNILSRLGVELEVGAFTTHPRDSIDDNAFGFLYRGQLALRVTPDHGNGQIFLVAGAGGMNVGESSDKGLKSDNKIMPHAGLAFKVDIGEKWGFRFDLKGFLGSSTQADDKAFDYEGTGTVYWTFGRRPDGPPAPKDSDGDGVTDDKDGCPDQAEDADGFQDDDGCPDPDNDGDGVLDAADKCPTEAGPGTADGCPSKDQDGDGIPDTGDKCPDKAEDKDGFEDEDGCPDPDNDGDGVLDANDKCGDKPETKNGFEDADGCPDEIPETVKKFTGVIKGINFVTGSAKITKGSWKTLDAAVEVMKANPSIKLEVSGHTDDKGVHDKNVALSQARADSVKAYLVSKGIEDGRLVGKGYGPDKPLDPAKTAAARAKNRRVEFQLIQD